MSKHRLICYTIALAAFLSAYVGYRFYDKHVKPAPIRKAIGFEAIKEIKSTDRTFLQRAETLAQLPRQVTRRSSLLTPPVWVYTPQKWDSGATDSVKVIAMATDVVGFHATESPDRQTDQLPLPKEKILLDGNVVSVEEVVRLINTIPESASEFPPPSFHELQIPADAPIPYPLIAKAFDSPDDVALTELGDWIKSVGGAARAQSLIEAAGLADSIRIETVTSLRQ